MMSVNQERGISAPEHCRRDGMHDWSYQAGTFEWGVEIFNGGSLTTWRT